MHVLNDPYQRQIEETVSLVMARLKEMGYTNDHTLASHLASISFKFVKQRKYVIVY